MPKSLVGTVKNKRFAFFWLLVGGSIGNLLTLPYVPNLWPILLPPTILSIVMAIAMAGTVKRPRIWLSIDLILTAFLLLFFLPPTGSVATSLAIWLPDLLIIFGCILGVMKW
ncbi:MAG: hypothetical protein KGH72_06125 [Candidatus Micrarchaeota archaeon]|nr:hypothetical protein [Candidatus Micrarchaeota archaeon]